MSIAYRAAGAEDMNLIVESFLRSFRDSHAAGLIAVEDWHSLMEPQVRKLLARPGSEVVVAVHPGETDGRSDIYGWIAVERGHAEPLVVFCYVKHAYRRLGIARGLFLAAGIDPAAPFLYAAKTPSVAKLAAKIPRSRWAPLAARFPRDQPQKER